MPGDTFAVALDRLPVATLATRDGVFVACNRAFVELAGWNADDIVGKTLRDLLDRLVAPRDRAILERLAKNRTSAEPQPQGSLWCRVLAADGAERPVRIEWNLDANGRDALVFLFDARPEMLGQEVTEALARVAGVLSRCATEDEVLVQAVDALAARGFTATALLIDEGDPLLRYGPSRSPDRPRDVHAIERFPRLPKDVLTKLNPGFVERRTAFFQDGMRLVREAYSEPIAEQLLPYVPAPRMVQAPLFLADAPYGALVVTSAALTPLLATAIDLFAELVGKALETVRLRRERVERERLAALGEAAAVMAHEVRNPVGSIMNALALLQRDDARGPAQKSLLAIIGEETARLEHLVSQLLELGRPLLPRPRTHPLEELTKRAVRLLSGRGELRDQTIELPTTEATLACLDPDLVELAVVNVLRNAVQSNAPRGTVRISVAATDGVVRWTCEDEGPGIPDDVAARLGQPFVTTRATGTGMGLAVVRRIMEANAGQVTIERGASGGAKVTLEFPAPSDDTRPDR